jgi:hypothetical protein
MIIVFKAGIVQLINFKNLLSDIKGSKKVPGDFKKSPGTFFRKLFSFC